MINNKVWENFRAADVPSEIQSALMAMAEQDDNNAYETGRLVELMFDWARAEEINIPSWRMYRAAATWRGKSASTVRVYHWAYKNIPKTVIDDPEYSMLCLGQIICIIGRCETEEDYRKHLDLWKEHSARTGVAVGAVDAFRAWVKQLDGGPPPEYGRHTRIVQSVERLIDSDVPDDIKEIYRKVLELLETCDWELRP